MSQGGKWVTSSPFYLAPSCCLEALFNSICTYQVHSAHPRGNLWHIVALPQTCIISLDCSSLTPLGVPAASTRIVPDRRRPIGDPYQKVPRRSLTAAAAAALHDRYAHCSFPVFSFLPVRGMRFASCRASRRWCGICSSRVSDGLQRRFREPL